MPCELYIATEVKRGALEYDPDEKRAIGAFLLALQQNPLPAGRQRLNRQKKRDAAFYTQLQCGIYISWEIAGDEEDVLHMVLTGETEGIMVRVLGIERVQPE
jgi:hypothetical protein